MTFRPLTVTACAIAAWAAFALTAWLIVCAVSAVLGVAAIVEAAL